MSDYAGNPSLASAVKERVNSTFQQTVALYKQGRTDEVVAGCTLILQMDPLFDPAKKLLEQARNPQSGRDVDSLLPGPGAGAHLEEARAALAGRDFERVIQITTEILTNDLLNDEARLLADEAREKIESSPFVEQFARKAGQQLAAGNAAGARAELDKARALDAGHPAVRRLLDQLAAKQAAPAAPGFDASSFVVDTPPPAAGRGSAQASDFGFTFEEDKNAGSSAFANFSFGGAPQPAAPAGGGFSFDTPVAGAQPFSFEAPPKTPVAGDFDFSTASIETSPDDQKKIDGYLAEGDRAFEEAHYQQAIDLWSRIFLIDVTNEAASERIERAKAKRTEIERQAEGILAAGVQAFERNDFATARQRFNEVLLADPGNASAADYVRRIDSGGKAAAPSSAASPSAHAPEADFFADDADLGAFEAPLVPPDARPEPERVAKKKPMKAAAPVAAPARRPSGLILGALAAVVLIAGGWFVWSKFMSEPAADPAATRAIIERAAQLGSKGQYDLAISSLQDIKPGDPQYDKALNLIADLQQKKARASAMIDGRPAAVFYQENLDAARMAFEAHDFVSAKKGFEQAIRVKALPADMKAMYDQAAQQVAKLDAARTLFAERKYGDVVAALQPMLQADPQNKNIQRMILDAHFNLGATALQEERLPDAVREFEEVLASDPNDELAKRSLDLARRYDGQTKDLLYKIYVKYLPLRQPPVA